MYFGDYLIQKNVISSDQLIKALCFQIENLPSMIRLVWEANIVDSKELMDLIKTQIQNDSDIIKVLVENKKIKPEKINELELLQMSRKMPLGEVLIKLNFTEVQVINNYLKEFYENKFHMEENKNQIKENKIEASAQTAAPIELSAAALESLRELGMELEQTPVAPQVYEAKQFIDQYADLFSEKFKNKLKKLIEILSKETETTSDISNYYNSLYRDLHLLKGAIALSELKSQEELIIAWESQIESVLTKSNDEIRTWCKKNLALLDQSINLFWISRQRIIADQTDEAILLDEQIQEDINSILDKIAP